MSEAQARRGGREARRRCGPASGALAAGARAPAPALRGAGRGAARPHPRHRRCACSRSIGIDFREDEALALWREAGAEVEGQRVRIPRELLMGLVAKAPERFTLHARNPGATVEIGGDTQVFGPTYGSPFVRGFDGERRYGTIEDLQQLPQAGLHGAGPAEHRRGDLRAGRRRHPQAAPAHHRLGDPPQRQELHGPGDPPRAGPRTRCACARSCSARSSSTTTR